MRKYLTSLLAILLMGSTSLAISQEPQFALKEDFENWPLNGWTLNPEMGSNGSWLPDQGWTYGPYYSYQGYYCAMHNNFEYNVDIRGSMTSPEFNLAGFDNPQVSFMWINQAKTMLSGQFAKMIIYRSDDGKDFISMDTITAANCEQWKLYEKTIPNTTRYIKIQAISNYGGDNTFVDFFHVGDRPLLMPSKLSVPFGSRQTRQAEAQWEAYDGVEKFEIAWGKKGFDIEEATIEECSTTTYIMTGLTPDTEHEFCVRSVYDNGSKSDWSYRQSFTTLPTCPPVEDVIITNLEANSVTLSWIEKGDAKRWQIEWGESGFKLGSGNLIENVDSNPFTIEDLPSASFLEAYVRGVCAEGDTSAWVSTPIKFQTACTEFELPYFEDFSTATAYQEDWTTWIYQLANPCWETKQGLLPATGQAVLEDIKPSYNSWYGVSFAHRAQKNLSMMATISDKGCWLLTPSFDLGDGNKSYTLQFDVALTYERSMRKAAPNTDDDRFAVLISPDNGNTWTSQNILMLWDNQNSENVLKEIPNYGKTISIDLSGYTGKVRIAFYVESTESDPYWKNDVNDLFIDNFSIREQPENLMVAQSIHNADYLTLGEENEISVEVFNAGSLPQKDLKVSIYNELDELQTETVFKETIYPGEYSSIPMTWTPNIKGEFMLEARIDMENDIEQNKLISYPVKSEIVGSETRVNIIGEGRMRNGNAPACFFNNSSQSQMIYMEDEISSVGVITALKFGYITSMAHLNFPLKVRMGTVSKSEFDHTSDWNIPDSLKLVFNGFIDSIDKEGDLLIKLDEAFTYSGGNLLVMVEKGAESPSPSYYTTGEDFWHTHDAEQRNRTLAWSGNDDGGDKIGSLLTSYPNVVFYIDSMSSGRIRGRITENGNTNLNEAQVEILGTALKSQSNAQGEYEINRVLSGTYDVKASKFGYFDSVQKNISVNEIEIVTVNFDLKKLPTYQVKGKVVANTGESLRGVSLFLEGYENYEVSTISDGSFTFHNVYAPKTYTLKVRLDDYSEFDTTITVSNKDEYINITLNEITHPAIGFRAEVEDGGEKMKLVWESPADMTMREITLDDGTPENGMTATPFQNIRIGNLYSNEETLYISSIRLYGEPNEKAGEESVNFELYDENRILIASSNDFKIPENGWIEVKLPYMVKVEGDYYVMVNFPATNENPTHYVSADETGPHSGEPITYYIAKDGKWLNMIEEMQAPPMVFMIRPTVFKEKASNSKAVESYNVWKLEPGKENEPETWSLLTPDPITATSLEERNWKSYEIGTTHQYAIQAAYTGNLFSDYAFCKAVVKENILAPIDFQAYVSEYGVRFVWKAAENSKPIGYVLSTLDTVITTDKTNALIDKLPEAGEYSAELTAIYNNALSDAVEITFIVEDDVANEPGKKPSAAIYPNPARNRVFIDLNQEMESIKFWSINGQLLKAIQNPSHHLSIDLNQMPKGMVIIEFTTNDGAYTQSKLMIVE